MLSRLSCIQSRRKLEALLHQPGRATASVQSKPMLQSIANHRFRPIQILVKIDEIIEDLLSLDVIPTQGEAARFSTSGAPERTTISFLKQTMPLLSWSPQLSPPPRSSGISAFIRQWRL